MIYDMYDICILTFHQFIKRLNLQTIIEFYKYSNKY